MQPVPSSVCGRFDVVSRQAIPEGSWDVVVQQYPHRFGTYSNDCIWWLRTASIWWRITPGNHSMNSSIVAPSFRLLNRAVTGTLVPLNTHAPLTLPGLLSMAVHVLQSFMVLTCVCQLRWGVFCVDGARPAFVVPAVRPIVNRL